MAVPHAEGFETFAIGDDRSALDATFPYDFRSIVATSHATIVANPDGGQALSIALDDSTSAAGAIAWHLNIGGVISDPTFIRSFALYPTSLPSENWPLLSLIDYETAALCTYVLTSTGAIQLRRGTVSGTLIDATAAGVVTAGERNYLEFLTTLDPTAGEFEVRVNETTQMADTSVNTTNTGGVTCYQLSHGGPTSLLGPWLYDDAVLIDESLGVDGNEATTFLGDINLVRRATNGNYINTWSRNDTFFEPYQLVNEDGQDGNATYVHSGTPGAIEMNEYEDVDFNREIVFVAARPVLRKDDTGTRTAILRVESNGVVRISDPYDPSTDNLRLSHVWERNPATGFQWGPSEYNAAKFGAEVGNP